MSSPPKFRHDALADPTLYIRLLKILNGDANERLTCAITTCTVKDAPSYYAMSYTWGDPNDTATIIINGSAATVTANCEYALRQAHACTTNVFLWMDALSIDQSSTEEKEYQVAMMGQIYERAAHVLACIGPQSDDSEFLFEFIDAHQVLLRDITSHMSLNLVSSTGGWSLPNPIPRDRSLSLRSCFAVRMSRRKRVLTAFVRMMKRAYFSRVWILQELHSASRSSFCCGTEVRPFNSLAAISMLTGYWMSQEPLNRRYLRITRLVGKKLSRLTRLLRRHKYVRTFGHSMEELYSGISERHGCLTLASGTRALYHLPVVMRAISDFECADVRDKLYGVLSLVDWEKANGGRTPTPDYTKDAFTLAVAMLQEYLDNPQKAWAYGCNLHWAEQMRQVFEIVPGLPAMRTAVRKHCSNGRARGQFMSREHLHLANSIDKVHRPQRPEPFPSFFEVKSPVNQGNTWFGKHLLDYADAKRYQNAADTHLFLRTTSGKQYYEIVDQSNTTIAYVPTNTRPYDIYLFAHFLYKEPNSPPSMIVRVEVGFTYEIVGPAFGFAYEQTCLTWAESWTRFRVEWSAEDLLLFTWAHQHATLMSHSLSENATWLDLNICGSAGSSYVKGIVSDA
jgi:hypothetical protein